MINVKRLGHTTLETPDITGQIEYFQRVLGLVLVGEEADKAYLATPAGQTAVVLERAEVARTSKLAFEVSPDIAPADLQRFLKGVGIDSDVCADAMPGVERSISFKDEKGTDIELFSKWEVTPETVPASGSIAPLKLGHVAFVVPDPKRTEAFYREVLGFRTSDWIGEHFVFMRCSPDHHTVNFVRGDGPPRMHHIAFELRDRSHMFDACDRIGDDNRDIIWGPLRHGPGHNLATYHRTPDSQTVELYVEMDRMYDEEACYFEPRPWHEDAVQRPKTWKQEESNMWGLAPSEAYRTY